MALDNDLIADILKHTDIVRVVSSYITVTKKGRDYVAKCPFHDDHDPSMHISPEKQIFKCFVCGASGSAFKFVQLIENISFPEAVKKVAEIIGYHDDRLNQNTSYKKVDKSKEPLLNCLKDLSTYYQYCLNTVEGRDGLYYLESRHLDYDIRHEFEIGYAPKDGFNTIKFLSMKEHQLKTIEDCGISSLYNGEYFDKNQGRVIFPIWDKEGNVIGYSARRIVESSDAKYVNSPETPVFHKSEVLYNFHKMKKTTQLEKYVYVLEGFMDVIALYKVGIKSAVALMGTAFTDEHLRLLRSLNVEIRLCLDGDKAGQDATFKIAQILSRNNISLRVVDATGFKKDSDEILNNDGEEALKTYLNRLLSFNDFLLSYFTNTRKLTTVEEKKKLILTMLPFLHNIKSQLEATDYLYKISKLTGFEVDAIKDIVKRSKNKTQNDKEKIIKSFHPERKAVVKLYRAEKCMLMLMLQDNIAIDFYLKEVKSFYDIILNNVAKILCSHYEETSKIYKYSELIVAIEASSFDNKEEMVKEINSIEEGIIIECTPEILQGTYETIVNEKAKIDRQDRIYSSIEGKDEEKQSILISDAINEKIKKM